MRRALRVSDLPPLILSLCDYSGNWSDPYSQAGYEVEQVDLKRDVFRS